MLASCGPAQDASQNNVVARAPPPSAPTELTALEIESRQAVDTKRNERRLREMEARARRALEAELFDPFSARFRNVRAGRNGAICGQYNAKNRLGAYVGFRDFVVGRDGRTIYASQSNNGVRSEFYSSFAEAYLNVCATSAESAQYRRTTGIANPAALRVPQPSYEPDYSEGNSAESYDD